MAINRTFADLSSYRKAVNDAQGTTNLLDSILGGIQQGVQLQRLPQTLQSQDIAQQLQNAINLQKLQDLQNPQAAIARQIEKELTIKGALDSSLGLTNLERGLGTIGTPGAITAAQQATLPSNETLAMRQAALEQGGVPLPNVVIPRAQAGLPLTEVAPFGIGTGVYSDPSIPLAAAQRARDAELNQMLAELQAKSQFDVSTAEARAAALEPFEQRKFQREADLKRGLSDTEFTNQMKVLEARHQNALSQGDRDSANKLANDMAVLRENNKAPKSSKPPTESQATFQLYGTRMEKASKILDDLSSFDPKEGASMLPNRLKSPTRQNIEQAERDFLNAVLRKESGATITDVEFENGRRQYFRQPGDSAATITQKKANRDLVTAEFKRLGGIPQAGTTSEQDEALKWLQDNPNHPDAAQVRSILGL